MPSYSALAFASVFTIFAFVLNRSSLVIPGFLGIPSKSNNSCIYPILPAGITIISTLFRAAASCS